MAKFMGFFSSWLHSWLRFMCLVSCGLAGLVLGIVDYNLS